MGWPLHTYETGIECQPAVFYPSLKRACSGVPNNVTPPVLRMVGSQEMVFGPNAMSTLSFHSGINSWVGDSSTLLGKFSRSIFWYSPS